MCSSFCPQKETRAKMHHCPNFTCSQLHLSLQLTTHLKPFLAPAWSLYLSVPQVICQSLLTALENGLFWWFFRLFLNAHIVWCSSLAIFALWIRMVSLTPHRTSLHPKAACHIKAAGEGKGWKCCSSDSFSVPSLRTLNVRASLESDTFSGSRPETQQSYWCQVLFLMQAAAWAHKIYF